MQHIHREVRRLLHSLRQANVPEKEPIGRLLQSALQTTTVRAAVVELAQRALAPCPPQYFSIIRRHDIENISATQVAKELYLSVRQFHRYHTAAMDAIAGELQRHIQTINQSTPSRAQASLDATALYGRGRYFWTRRTRGGFQSALEFFEQSLRVEPNYARAYVGIAETHMGLAQYLMTDPGPAFERAIAALSQALEIDPALAEAHAALSDLQLFAERDWKRARRSLQRSLVLDEAYPLAHLNGAWHGFIAQRFSEADSHVKRLLEMDPGSVEHQIVLGLYYLYSFKLTKALDQFRFILSVEPANVLARYGLALSLAFDGQHSAAIEEFDKVRHEYPQQAFAYAGYCEASSGNTAAARARIDYLNSAARQRYVSPFTVALIYAGLHDSAAALHALEKSVDGRDAWAIFIPLQPEFRFLRSQPRFTRLLKQVAAAA